MNKETFFKRLDYYGIDKKIVCFDDTTTDDVFCVMKNYDHYDVYYRERGKEFYNKRFRRQEDALQYLLDYLCNVAKYL